jgi:transposase
MFLRSKRRFKNGKCHRYFSVVENRRLPGDRVVQRQVLYLGEINDSQEAAWRKTLEVFDEQRQASDQMSLFPEDREIPPDAVNALSLRMEQLTLRRCRSFGDCWLGLTLWRELKLDQFWKEAFADEAGNVEWERVLAILAINRLVDPGSEWRIHREWFLSTALDELLGVDFEAASKDRLYRCLDRLVEHKDALHRHLVEQWRTLFNPDFDVLLYDLTSTYFEGLCEEIPKAKHGYSRDGRPDCRQVVIALVVTTDGLPLAYEVLPGNTADKTTLNAFIAKIEELYGKMRRVWVMDRGIPTQATLERMRSEGIAYLVGTPKSLLRKQEQEWTDRPWEQVHEGMRVKLLKQDGELYVLAQSEDRRKKENAIRRRKLQALVHGLNRLKRRAAPRGPASANRRANRDYLIEQVAILKKAAGRVAYYIDIRKPTIHEPINRETFVCRFDRAAWKKAQEQDGSYILRAGIPWEDWPAELDKQAPVLWSWYMQLVQVEQAFKTLKGDLSLRPIFHQVEPRVEAHILVAFLGYALSASLRLKLKPTAPGLTPRAVLEKLSTIRMVDVCIPTTDHRLLVMPRYVEPEQDQQMILDKLHLSLPPQPPPRIRSDQALLPTTPSSL